MKESSTFGFLRSLSIAEREHLKDFVLFCSAGNIVTVVMLTIEMIRS